MMIGWQRSGMKALLAAGASLAALAAAPAHAQDATWSATPENATFGGRSDYTAPGNWVGGTVPTGTATFDATSETDIFFDNRVRDQHIMIGRFVFTAGAPAYTFTLESDELSFTGQGIVNNSSAIQTLIAGNRSTLHFTNSSSAGNASLQARGGNGNISFENNSNAGTAAITAGVVGSAGGLQFRHNSSAANATIANPAGTIVFFDASTGGSAAIDNRNLLTFRDTSSIGNATIANNALIRMFMSANGPAGTIVNNAGATVDISAAAADNPAASVSIGSLSGAGNVRLGARNLTLGALDRNDTIGGVIADGGDAGGTGGSLTKIGTGTLTLSGASTYTGATTVNGGTLLLTGSITGAGATMVGIGSGANGRLTIQSGATMTTTGDARIGEAGGNGTVTVTGAGSSWTIGGGLNVANSPVSNHVGRLLVENGATVTSASAGILRQTNIQTADGAATISGAGSVWNSGDLTIQSTSGTTVMTIQSGGRVNSAAVNLNGGILATGSGTVWNTGQLSVGGRNANVGGIPAGRLTIAASAVVNSSGAVIAEGGSFTSVVTIDGAGSAWNTGTNLVLSPTASYSGQVSVLNGGALTVAGGSGTISVGPNGGASFFTIGDGAPGTTPGTVNAAGILVGGQSILSFDHVATNYQFAPAITGSGRVFAGRGTTILTGDSSAFAGTTTIDAAGILQIGNGGGGGSLAGNIANNSVLVINRSGALTLGGVISGTGTFAQNGNVTTTLSGANTYTGATTLNGGTLLVTGAIGGSAVTVNDNATLGGTGTVGPTTIANGGFLAPGTSIGTLAITGNLAFATGSNFLVEVAPASADRVNVTGTASLAGTLTALSLGGTFSASEYNLLTAAGGLTGTFGSLVTQGSFGTLTPSLRYSGSSVFLVLAAGRDGPTNTVSTSQTDTIIFNAPTIIVQRVGLFETRIIGRLAGGVALFDQTFNDAFGSATVLNGLAAARAAITTAGGPGIVIISDPVLISRTVSSTTSSASIFSLAGSSDTVTSTSTFGPATITIGDRRSCGAAVAALPDGTRPACGAPGGQSFDVAPGTVNVNTNTQTEYRVDEARTDTITETTRETYELTGTVVPVGTVHAAVQSGLFDSAGRFLHRLGREGVQGLFGSRGGAPRRGGWAEAYALDGGRDARNGLPGEQGDSAGFAAGFSLDAGPGVSLGFGADHGWTDVDVAATGEAADVRLTQFGLQARLGTGPFGVGAALTYGAGEVDSSRAFLGVAQGAYDVELLGAFVEARYDIDLGGWRLTPAAGLDWVRVESDAFTESGPLGFIVPAAEQDRTRAFAGAEIGGRLGLGGRAALELTGYARYLAVLDGEERALPIVFAAAPGTPLVMRGIDEEDSILLGAQARLELSRSVDLYFGYDGRFGGGQESHAGIGGVRVRW